MEPRYEIIIFRRNDFFSLLERVLTFGRGSFGMRVRREGEQLSLPNDAEIVETSNYFSETERDKRTGEFEKKYRPSKYL